MSNKSSFVPLTGVFVDWAGQEVSYIVSCSPVGRGVQKFFVYIDPHKTGEFSCFGRGVTVESALDRTVSSWNAFDSQC